MSRSFIRNAFGMRAGFQAGETKPSQSQRHEQATKTRDTAGPQSPDCAAMSLKLIITGMHRSGTSLTASFVNSMGVNVGNELYPADAYNPKGYFEDVEFLSFNRKVLKESTRTDEFGWPDWGWSVSEKLTDDTFAKYEQAARELINTREAAGTSWGFKDPRTTLLLDFWYKLIPEAKFLLVYRAPWDVAESMMRAAGAFFPKRPDYTMRIWTYYNQALLKFYRAHRDKCLLVEINGVTREPQRFIGLLKNKLGVEISDRTGVSTFKHLYTREIFHALGPDHPVARLSRRFSPREYEILGELEREADLPGKLLSAAVSPEADDDTAALPLLSYGETITARNETRALEEQIRARDMEISQLRLELADARRETDKLSEQMKQLRETARGVQSNQDAQLEKLNRNQADQSALVNDLRRQLHELETRMINEETKRLQLEVQRTHLENVVGAMKQTKIWRMRTAMLKLVGRNHEDEV